MTFFFHPPCHNLSAVSFKRMTIFFFDRQRSSHTFFKFSKIFIVVLLGQWVKKTNFTTSTPKYNQLGNKGDGKLCHV